MKRLSLGLSLLAIAVLLAGCGQASSTQGKPSTPQQLWDAYVSAMKSDDAQSFLSLISSGYITNIGGANASAGDALGKWNSLLAAPATYATVNLISIQQSGDQATAKFTFTGHEDYTGQIVLVREGDTWKIASGTSIRGIGG